MTEPPRFLMISYPAQGHMNPALHFAERLIRCCSAQVTYVTTLYSHRRAAASEAPHGLSFSPFSDGYDDGFKPGTTDTDRYNSDFARRGSRAIRELVHSALRDGRPYHCLVYTILLPWAADVAAELRLPAALLWIQPATVFDIYYHHFFNGYEPNNIINNSQPLTFPGLSHLGLTTSDLPSFLGDSTDHNLPYLRAFRDQFKVLDRCKDSNKHQKILVNTFDALEPDALRAVEELGLVAIGPLVPPAFLGDENAGSFRCDLYDRSRDYAGWLSSKPDGSVVYVSFGSISVLPMRQMEEIGRGLLGSGRPFLWVIRDEADRPSCAEELEGLGMIVPWCSQVEVLSSPSLGCFLTHCGWNSTLESLACGVPVVAFPQWSDQRTNAKLVEDYWRVGVRVRVDEEDDDGIVGGEEIRRCLELVVEGEEFRRNANKWKGLARE